MNDSVIVPDFTIPQAVGAVALLATIYHSVINVPCV